MGSRFVESASLASQRGDVFVNPIFAAVAISLLIAAVWLVGVVLWVVSPYVFFGVLAASLLWLAGKAGRHGASRSVRQ